MTLRPLTAVLLLAVATATAAQEPEQESEPEEGPVHQGGTILVRDQRVRKTEVFADTAIETEVIRSETIQATPGTTNVGDVLQDLSGVRVQSRVQGQRGAVSIEGMPAEYTLLLVDGQRWSGEIGGVGDATDIPVLNVERIELMRGNQGARFGTDAAGGVVNVITRKAPQEGSRLVYDGHGGDDERWLGGGAGAMRLGPVGISVMGQYERIDGFDAKESSDIVDSTGGGSESTDWAGFVYATWDMQLSDSISVHGNGLWREERDEFVDDTDVNTTVPPRKDRNWRTLFGFDWLATDEVAISADARYYRVNTESLVGREFELTEDEIASKSSLDYFFETGPFTHALLGGYQVQHQRLDLDEGALPPEIENDDLLRGREVDETFTIQSVYAQNETTVSDRVSLVLGVRGRFHSDFDTKVLPQVGLLLKPFDQLKLRASWGLNHRTPSLRDLYQPPTPQLNGAYFLAGNEDLKAEDSMSVRGGFEWSPADWLSVATAGYYNDLDDHIRSARDGEIPTGTITRLIDPTFREGLATICEAQALFFPPEQWTPDCVSFFNAEPVLATFPRTANLFRKTNLDEVRTWGVESQLRIGFRYARLLVDYTWLRTDVEDSNVDADELPNEPKHSVSGRLILTVPGIETQLSAAARWRSGVIPEGSGTGSLSFADASERTNPSYSIDLQAVQPIQSWLNLYFNVENVTDEDREDSYAARGRTWYVGIRGTFETPWSAL